MLVVGKTRSWFGLNPRFKEVFLDLHEEANMIARQAYLTTVFAQKKNSLILLCSRMLLMLLSLQLHSNGNCQAKVYFVFIAGNGFQCNMKRHQILVLLSAASFVACIGGFCGDLFNYYSFSRKSSCQFCPTQFGSMPTYYMLAKACLNFLRFFLSH